MRKNQFRSILLAALVVTAIGGLNSCKDYDDDIAELRNELRTNSTDLSSLVADKVHNLEIEANNLQAQLSSLETAYKNADAALQTSINNAVADAKSAAAGEAASKAEAAEKAANSYADVKAAEAQRAAVAAATTLVTDAQNALKGSIDAANATIAEQGKTITGLLQADKELQQGITTATARANEAYTLASQALDAAKAAQAAAEKAQGTADEAKLQAAQNATNLATIAENLKNAQETLNSQINVFGQQVTSAAAQAAENKAKIEGQATQLADMKAANQKAQDAIEALGNKVNDQVEALKGLISTNQKQIEVLQNGLESVKGDVASLQTAVAGLIAADNGIQTKIDELFGEASARIATLTGTVGTNEASIKSLQDALTALQNGDIKSLQDAVKGLEGQIKDAQGAATEEIGKATAAVNQLKGQLGTLQGVVDALTANAVSQTDIDNAVNALATTVGANYDDLKGQIEALKGGIPTAAAMAAAADAAAKAAADAAVAAMVKEYDLSGINASIAELKTNYSDIDTKIKDAVAVEASKLKAELEEYVKGLIGTGAGEGQAYDDSSLQGQIDIIAQVLADYFGIDLNGGNTVKMKEGEEAAAAAASLAEKLKAALEASNYASSKQANTLTSLTLIPDVYINGIEALQFVSLQYTPLQLKKDVDDYGKLGRSLEKVKDAKTINAFNGLKTAYYRMSPKNVKLEDIDVNGVQFVNNSIPTITRAGIDNIKINTPILPVKGGISILDGGILSVKLQKDPSYNESLKYVKDGVAKMISLKVPRADGTDDIYSEFTMVDEDYKYPAIAATKDASSEKWPDGYTHETAANSVNGHYVNFKTISESTVSKLEYIKVKIPYYTEGYDLINLVTGCDLGVDGTLHKQILRSDLESYGLKFEFTIPGNGDSDLKDFKYEDEHKTNQQKFVKFVSEGSSKIVSQIEDASTNKRAAVGKTPIIRVKLVDTNNGNALVDDAYFKIQWTDKEPTVIKPITLETWKAKVSTLLSCDDMTDKVAWEWFINKVYGDKEVDMSYNEFKSIYDSWKTESEVGTITVEPSTPGGDAHVATWTISTAAGSPDLEKLGTIDLTTRTKVLKGKVTFISNQPDAYGNIEMPWEFEIKLPNKPTLNGHYVPYWMSASVEEHEVLPIQFNTAAQTLGYAVYNNNLFNAFTFNDKTGLIINGVPTDCGYWDIQFSNSDQLSNFVRKYNVDNNNEPLEEIGVADDKFVAYQYVNKVNNAEGVAARINWQALASSWQHDKNHMPYLFADHKNANTNALINAITAGDKIEIGKQPERNDHSKPISLSIWAKYNKWNKELIKKYKIYLIAPLCVKSDMKGVFEEGISSGTMVDCSTAFTMIDFRGYEVAATTTNTSNEFTKYAADLYKYYEVETPVLDVTKAKFGLVYDKNSGNIDGKDFTIDEIKKGAGMTSADLNKYTNGNIDISISEQTNKAGNKVLVYKNNQGNDIGTFYYVYIPVTLDYGFGTIEDWVKIPVYPRGQVPAELNDYHKYFDGTFVK